MKKLRQEEKAVKELLGGGEPRGLEDVTTEVTGSEEFNTRQGRGEFTVTTNEIEPGAGGFECPSA